MKAKRIFSILLTLVLIASLFCMSACTSEKEDNNISDQESVTENETSTEDEMATEENTGEEGVEDGAPNMDPEDKSPGDLPDSGIAPNGISPSDVADAAEDDTE